MKTTHKVLHCKHMAKEQRYVPTTKDQEFVETLHQFAGKWVALSPDMRTVVSSGDSVEELDASLDPSQQERVIFMKVQDAGTFLVA